MHGNATSAEEYLATLPDWQAQKLTTFRELIHSASPDVSEAMKWGVPTFIYKGKMLFTMAGFKVHIKYNFNYNGAELDDTSGLFNNGLESKKSRSIDVQQDQTVDKTALKDLIMQSLAKL